MKVLFSMGTNITTHLQPKQSPSLQVATYLGAIFPYLPWTHCSLPQPNWLVFPFLPSGLITPWWKTTISLFIFELNRLQNYTHLKGTFFQHLVYHLAFPHEFTSLWNQTCYQLFQFGVFSKLKPWNVKFDMR